MQRRTFAGLEVVVENPAGSTRRWYDRQALEVGSTIMRYDYGFLEGHVGVDGDELDCYLGPDETAPFVFVIHQLARPDYRRHDEDKVMIGFRSEADAKAAFLSHRNDGDHAYGGMTALSLEAFKSKLQRRTGSGKIRHEVNMKGAILFDASRGTDGKVRTLVWDRICVPGSDEKDGQSTEFSLETLSQMVENFEERGDPIPIDFNHQSNYSHLNGQPAPALGFYGAFAVVLDGKIQKIGALSGVDASNVEGLDLSLDGLWGLRTEVTELGDQLLPNFKLLSPTFSPEGVRRDGSPVGYSLAAVAATNTPWQSGTRITFDRDGKVITMARYSVDDEGGGGKDITASSDEDAIEQAKRWVNATGTGAQVWNLDTNKKIAFIGRRGDVQRFDSVSMAYKSGDQVSVMIENRWRKGVVIEQKGKVVRVNLPDEGREVTSSAEWVKQFSMDSAAFAAEAAPKGQKGSGTMPPELLAKLGLPEGASPDEIMAAFASYEAKMAAPVADAPAMDGGLPMMEATDEDDKKMEGDKKDEDAKMAVMSATVSALQAKLSRLEKKEAEREAIAAREALQRFELLADEAIAGGYPKDKRAALIKFARSDFEAARATVAPFLARSARPAHLFDRLSQNGAPVAPGAKSAAREFQAGPPQPRKVQAMNRTFIEDDAVYADEIKMIAFSQDPATMAKVDRLLPEHHRADKFQRLLAAGRIVRAERPDLAGSAE